MNSKFNAIYLALFLLVAITPLHVQAGTPTAPVVEQMANGTCEIVPNPDCRLVAGGCKGKFRETTWCTVNLPRGDGGNFACKNFGGVPATWCLATFTENSNGDMHSGDGHKSYSDLIRIEEEQEARIRNLDEQLTEQAKEIKELKNEPKVRQQVGGVPHAVVTRLCDEMYAISASAYTRCREIYESAY